MMLATCQIPRSKSPGKPGKAWFEEWRIDSNGMTLKTESGVSRRSPPESSDKEANRQQKPQFDIMTSVESCSEGRSKIIRE